MLFTITSKHFDITDEIRAHAEEKCSKLPRYYDSVNQIDVIIEGNKEGVHNNVELIARDEHSNVFVASETGDDTIACFDLALHKLERQLRRKKQKQRNNKHISGAGDMPAVDEELDEDYSEEEVV